MMQLRSHTILPRLGRTTLLSLLLAVGSPVVTVVLEGCSGSNQTSGRRLTLHTRVGVADNARSFTTPLGWHVTLQHAVIAGGPLYYFDGAPPLVQRRSTSEWRLAQRWFGLTVAHAHPGHYQAGNALGQMLEPWSTDLFDGSQVLPDGDGVSGNYRSARFSFHAQPNAAVAEVTGMAERDGDDTRFFRATAEFADVAKSATEAGVDGCEFREANIDADGTVNLEVHPEVWFELVDFSEARVGASETPVEFEVDSQPKLAFVQGVAQLSAYKFSFTAD